MENLQIIRNFIDENFYSQNLWYPDDVVKIGDTGFIRDQRVVPIQICPIQYNPAQKKLRIYRSLTFRVTFDSGTNQYSSEVGLTVPLVENVLQKILFNYESGRKWRKKIYSPPILQKSTFGFWYKIAACVTSRNMFFRF